MGLEDYKRKKHKKIWLLILSPILIPCYLIWVICSIPIIYLFWLLNIDNSNQSYRDMIYEVTGISKK